MPLIDFLTLTTEVIEEQDNTFTARIHTVWSGNKFPAETFEDKGFLTRDDAEAAASKASLEVKQTLEKK